VRVRHASCKFFGQFKRFFLGIMSTMNRQFFAVLAAALLAAPLAADAVPVHYDVNYIATQGPSGIGSFVYDSTLGAITNFTWNFGGVTGGIGAFNYGTIDVFGDTRGRFVFEILSQANAHAAVNCIAPFGGCSTSDGIVGAGPAGAFSFGLSSGFGIPRYFFFGSGGAAQGTIQVLGLPEPGTTVLFGLGLLAFGWVFRRGTAR
jgi:hypothetical protein